jgi:hypothetical protein
MSKHFKAKKNIFILEMDYKNDKIKMISLRSRRANGVMQGHPSSEGGASSLIQRIRRDPSHFSEGGRGLKNTSKERAPAVRSRCRSISLRSSKSMHPATQCRHGVIFRVYRKVKESKSKALSGRVRTCRVPLIFKKKLKKDIKVIPLKVKTSYTEQIRHFTPATQE